MIYQSDMDRANKVIPTPISLMLAMDLRKQWSRSHALTHSDRAHLELAHSGMFCTPLAAQVLASYGIIAVGDAVISDEHTQALLESSPLPVNDAEGT